MNINEISAPGEREDAHMNIRNAALSIVHAR